MKQTSQTQGFSILELMVAMISASILAITAGAMIFYAFAMWTTNVRAVELQRDETATMDLLTRKVREASAAYVTATNGLLQVRPGATNYVASFRKVGSNLEYDPGNGAGGQVLVNGRLVSFAATNMANGVYVELMLQDQNQRSTEKTRLTAVAKFRN